jgi:hypothetical protein
MSYQSILDSALTVIRNHNDVVGKDQPGYVDLDKFQNALKQFGATSEESLSKLKWEDILECLAPALAKDTLLSPKQLAKDIASVFRQSKEPEENAPVYVSDKRAQRMTLKELVECFDPEEPTSSVGKRLKSISKGNPFIVFSSGRQINTVATLRLLQEIKQGFPARDAFSVNDKPYKVYRIGELPDNYAEENPFYVGRPLRPDGTCDQTGRSWAGIPLNVRQFLRVGMKGPQISIKSIDDVHFYLDLIVNSENPLKTLRQRYQHTSILFDELEKKNELPQLRVALGNDSKEESNQKRTKRNPFEEGKEVEVKWFGPPSPNSNYYDWNWNR